MDKNAHPICFKCLLIKVNDEYKLVLQEDCKAHKDILMATIGGEFLVEKCPDKDVPGYLLNVVYIMNTPNWCQKPNKFNEESFIDCNPLPSLYLLTKASLETGPYNKLSEPPLPRNSKYMDSSIWNYCVWGEVKNLAIKDYMDDITRNRIENALKSIYHNYEKGYYLTSQGVEYVNFNARLSKESYLIGSQHSDAVSPFLFHSETLARKEMSKNGEDIQSSDFCCGYKWRFLLLDDFAETSLNSISPEVSSFNRPSKLSIIVDRLTSIEGMTVATRKAPLEVTGLSSEDGGTYKWTRYNNAGIVDGIEPDDADIAIEYVTSLADCEALLKKHKQYDIVLIDYLLGYKNKYSREYGYELLSRMRKWDSRYFGPGHRLYFMFITSFVHTVQERLEEQFLTRSTEKWYIGRGACPLNTPEIFLYNLHSIMKKRCSTLINLEIETDSGQSEKCIGKERIPTGLFPSRADEDFPRYCRERFRSLLNFVAEYRRLCDNDLTEYVSRGSSTLDSKDSRLARSIVEKENIQSVEFWEHFQHLYYLIAYEPKSRWPEWWEEYTILSNLVKEDESANGQKYTDMLNVLRDYIVKVSKQF